MSNVVDVVTVHLFERSGTDVWSHRARLNAESTDANSVFGASIALIAGRVLLGAPYADIGGEVDTGSMHLFQRIGLTTWLSFHRIVNLFGDMSGDRFGTAVASGRMGGRTVAYIGAQYVNVDGLSARGVVMCMDWATAAPESYDITRLDAPNVGAGSEFGMTLASAKRSSLPVRRGRVPRGRHAPAQWCCTPMEATRSRA